MITVHAPITVNTYDAEALARQFADLNAKIDALSLKFDELRHEHAEIDRLTDQLNSQQTALESTIAANRNKE